MISIIIPVFNAGTYLDRCLRSIINQTCSDWELILVDDGSMDDSGKICDRWCSNDSRIRVFHQKNQGASIARQVGIFASKGDYLVFVDADDVVESDYLEMLLAAMIGNGTDVAACDFIKHRENEIVMIDRTFAHKVLENGELHRRFFKYEFWGFPGKIYKRKVFEDLYFPKATINEDYVVMAQLFHRCQRIAYVPVPLYHYMMHGESLSNQRLSKRMMDEWYNKKWVLDYYQRISDFQWVPDAVAQTAETCCKLIGAISRGDNSKNFLAEKCEMQKFLRGHLLSLIFSRQLFWKLKVICVKRAFE